MATSVSNRINDEIGKKYLAPFSYKSIDQLPEMLNQAHFNNVTIDDISVDRSIKDVFQNMRKEILGHPAGPQVQEAGEDILQAIVEDVIEACTSFRVGEDLIVPQRVFLISAKAT